ncbi:hypothetical protein [Conexibacter sp. SYSU D00693]|uniref:hypothetical protein n=1 Tax=Conexibacter sp. SYSU D00693 TaxID=2812560 RepID=UPI00196B7A85|nr:hypothetical protein [Conexibacter sp. SYSU D00693]
MSLAGTPRRRVALGAAAGAACLAAGGLLGPLNNYDTAYSLLWGQDLVHGRTPDLEVALAPTPHPLATAWGALLSLAGTDGAIWLWQGTALAALLALGVLVAALGARWFGLAAGLLAAALVLTREPVLSFGLRAYVDLPYVCLLLAALLVLRRPRPALVLIGLAGLLRPEAWLFAGAYGAWLWHRRELRAEHVVLVGAAPVLWALHDLVLVGDPLWSLTGTRENADTLQRVTGLDDVPVTVPRRLGEVLREPVLVAAAGGAALTLLWQRARALVPAAVVVLALAAFCVLAAAGLPLLTRYLLLPAALLAVFAGAGALGWTQLGADDPRRRPWMAFGALVAVLLVAFAPGQVRRIDRLTDALDRQAAVLDDLHDAVTGPVPACRPLTLANRRGIPQTRLWTGLGPDDVRSAQDGPVAGTYVTPATPQVAKDFVLDARDRDRRVAPVPRGAAVRRDGAWAVATTCG